MNILDEDMQMVRDFLTEANAPFHIKEHFENLIAEHQKEADRVEELQGQVDSLEADESDEIEKLTDERNALQSELDEIVSDGMRGALETVKYALHDVIYLGKPLQIMPREMLRIVEEAL
jgi:predicted nuclease with TOPRIM domain